MWRQILSVPSQCLPARSLTSTVHAYYTPRFALTGRVNPSCRQANKGVWASRNGPMRKEGSSDSTCTSHLPTVQISLLPAGLSSRRVRVLVGRCRCKYREAGRRRRRTLATLRRLVASPLLREDLISAEAVEAARRHELIFFSVKRTLRATNWRRLCPLGVAETRR